MKGREYFKKVRKEFSEKYYKELSEARKERKLVAYLTGFLPSEILVAMDILPFYPETYATVVCAYNAANELCQAAEAAGISRDVCAFSTCALGSMYLDKGPLGGMPKPDLLISSSYTCGIHVPWWELMQKHYQVPLFVIDGPVLAADPEPRHIEFFMSQVKKLIMFLEKETQTTLDEDRFLKAIEWSDVASDYFSKILDLRKSIPSPISSRQICGDMFPIVTLPGTEETAQFYRELHEDTLEKVEKKVGVGPEEKFRLIWDNIPIWHDLDLTDYFERQGMIFVYETFFKEYWAKRLDVSKPFESLATKYLTGWTNRRLDRKIEIMEEIVKSYHVDGLVVFENRGCRAYSTGQLDVAKSLKEKRGLPYLAFEGNMADPGGHDPKRVRRMVDTFREILAGRVGGGETHLAQT
jgi:benzoyl-CoA reductase/2-hydroxyglutaryl-CoA dehydratase subunit BcrC/BadD/HgdB